MIHFYSVSRVIRGTASDTPDLHEVVKILFNANDEQDVVPHVSKNTARHARMQLHGSTQTMNRQHEND